jgi:hypothetical protein
MEIQANSCAHDISADNFSLLKYSYANAIGSAFEKPRIVVLSAMVRVASRPWANTAESISKIVLIVLLTASWFVSLIPSAVGNAIYFFNHTQILERNVSLAPPPDRTMSETVEVKLLRLVQEYKKLLILEVYPYDMNGLNYARSALGAELGFRPFKGDTRSIHSQGLVKCAMRSAFMLKYENVNRLIADVQTMINSRSYDPSFHDELVKQMREKFHIQNPEEYVASHFYTQDLKINDLGVNLLLAGPDIIRHFWWW